MGGVVNLRQVRKQKARVEKEKAAEQNRSLYGRTKAEKERDRLVSEHAQRFLEGHKRDTGSDEDRG